MLVCGGGDGVVGVWGSGEGKKKKEWSHFRAFDSKLYSVCWNHTAQVIACGGEKGVALHHFTGPKLCDLFPSSSPVLSLDIANTSKYLAAGLKDGQTMIWNLKSKTNLYTIPPPSSSSSSSSSPPSINCVAFNAGARHVASGSSSGKLSLLNLSNGQTTLSLSPSTWGVRGVSFSPLQRSWVGIVSENGCVDIWDTAKVSLAAKGGGGGGRGKKMEGHLMHEQGHRSVATSLSFCSDRYS